jgi:UPF0716 protein FxsA
VTQPPGTTSRRRAGRLRALWLLLLLAEILLILLVARAIGTAQTVLLLLATSVLGGWLVRHEGGRAWRALTSAAAGDGRVPTGRLGDSALILVGGILLFVPGFLTDLAGLVFVLPFTRPLGRLVLAKLIARRLVRLPSGVFVGRFPGGPRRGDLAGPDVVQGEVVQGEVVSDGEPTDRADGSGDDGAGRTS